MQAVDKLADKRGLAGADLAREQTDAAQLAQVVEPGCELGGGVEDEEVVGGKLIGEWVAGEPEVFAIHQSSSGLLRPSSTPWSRKRSPRS